MPSLRCYNKGCGKEFSPDDNGSNACQYHPGEPIFHDAKKKWSCCNKYSTDFGEFLSMKGCTFGPHNPVKPVSVIIEKPAPEINIAPPVQPAPNPIPKVPLARPSSDAPLKVLAPVVSPSLKTALEALRKNDTSITDAISDRDPKSCFNNGCKAAAIANGTFFAPLTSQCRFDWFQMPGTVTLSVYAKNVLPESADVRCNSVFLTLSFLYDGGKSHFERSFNLFGVIDPETSRLNLMATKLEVVMRKAEACSWSALEVKAPTPAGEEANKATN
ncbi:cysteine and histidine rich domain containing protein [Echinococcus multilocularis]|uniref:Cysteine and histidine rich domain containing protein n=1 Tax=Echinococcus multilocularis TaxID=6211 RepID=A0A068YMN5_ECHMU|nr:cysteine and histidine rich domain containing protein [Echinococcus multilocularis]